MEVCEVLRRTPTLRPLPDTRPHRFQRPVAPASPAFRENFLHPPRDACLLIRPYNLAIILSVRTPANTHVDNLERACISRLVCDIVGYFTHLLRRKHIRKGQIASDGYTPSKCAARRRGALAGHTPATQIGMRGDCSGRGRNSASLME